MYCMYSKCMFNIHFNDERVTLRGRVSSPEYAIPKTSYAWDCNYYQAVLHNKQKHKNTFSIYVCMYVCMCTHKES